MTSNYLCDTIRDMGYALVRIGDGNKPHIALPVVGLECGTGHTHAMCGKADVPPNRRV